MALVYPPGDELGDAGLFHKDSTGALIDFSSGYTFVVTILNPSTGTALVTKSTGVTGAAGSLTSNTPNITVAWADDELDGLTPGTEYPFRCVATRTADSKTRTFRSTLRILDTV